MSEGKMYHQLNISLLKADEMHIFCKKVSLVLMNPQKLITRLCSSTLQNVLQTCLFQKQKIAVLSKKALVKQGGLHLASTKQQTNKVSD